MKRAKKKELTIKPDGELPKIVTVRPPKDWSDWSIANLVSWYNMLIKRNDAEGVVITKFASRAEGVERLEALIAKVGVGSFVPHPPKRGAPIPTMAEAAEKASAPKKPRAVSPATGAIGIVAEFGARPGTVRAVLLETLHANLGKMVSVKTLSKACYGNDDSGSALKMSIKGAETSISKLSLPYQIKKDKTSFGLWSVK